MLDMKSLDYYEFLQISPNAEIDTIHRVYRYLAARYHPDNPASADPEKFALLRMAYEVLSDPARRAEYDATYQTEG
ncbi:MAG TPA: DnaJ domain-containing protein, partial [Terracidiphilus sp.]|nr:DnaJ domain-containing protein [Terracidiphilus sp.]